MQGLREDKLSYLPWLLALPVVAVVVIVATSGGPSVAETKSFSSAEESAIRRTENLLAGIPQRGTALGDPEALVTLQFFGDLQCRMSRQVMLGALPFLIRHWVRDGELRIVYRSTKSDTPDWSEYREENAAALAAAKQNRMWTFVDLFYREQRREFTHYVDASFLEGIAAQARLELRSWGEERTPKDWALKLEGDESVARARNLESTPSFLIGPTGEPARQLRHFSLEEPKVFDEAIEGLLQGSSGAPSS